MTGTSSAVKVAMLLVHRLQSLSALNCAAFLHLCSWILGTAALHHVCA